jgi:hypothetical protein
MKLRYLCPLAFLLAPGEASAAHCGHGQIYRVHLRTCVSARSALAHIAFRHHHRIRFTELRQDEAPPTPPHHHRRPSCDPASQCGDPIEDRVTETTTPRQEPPRAATTPVTDSSLPDAFGRSIMRGTPRQPWSR